MAETPNPGRGVWVCLWLMRILHARGCTTVGLLFRNCPYAKANPNQEFTCACVYAANSDHACALQLALGSGKVKSVICDSNY